MKLATLYTGAHGPGSAGPATAHTAAAVESDGTWRRIDAADLGAWLAADDREDLLEAARSSGEDLGSDPRFAVPVLAPRKVICCGLNYADHIAETGRETPRYPTLFTKFADSLVPQGAEVVLTGSERIDWEAELAVVVGATLTRPGLEEARAGIAGYTVANDVSMRDWQQRTLQWFQGKAWDASTPVGPVLVTPEEFDPAAGARIECRIGEEVVQSSTTDQLVFDAADLLAYIASFTTLRPGDLVLTGTPGGVGMALDPPRYLRDGDVVTTSVEGIGALTTTIRTSRS